MRRELRWLLNHIAPFVRLHALRTLCVVAGSLLAAVDPLILKWLIDDVLVRRRLDLLPWAGLGFLAVSVGGTVLGSVGGYVGTQAVERMVLRVRHQLIRHLQTLSASYHQKTPIGETTFRILQDVNVIGGIGSDLTADLLRTAIMSVITFGTMLVLNPRLTLAVLVVVPFYFLVRHYYKNRLMLCSERRQEASASLNAFLTEHFSAIMQLQLLTSERYGAQRAFRHARENFEALMAQRRMEIGYGALSVSVTSLGMALCLVYGGYEVLAGQLSIGGLVAFQSYIHRLFQPFAFASNLYSRLQRVRVSMRRVLELFDLKPDVADLPQAVSLSAGGAPQIVFDNVSFGYSAHSKTLEEINLRFHPGERVAVIGASGSGKTTLAKIIARLYDPGSGCVTVGEHLIQRLRLRSLRSAVTVIPQEPVLFDGSLRENCVCGRIGVSQEKLDQIARIAQLQGVIGRLGRGWDEPLGPGALALSGGERQRVAIARALLREPRVLVLDESTSGLDAATENALLDALAEFCRGMTAIVISHRMNPVLWADRIILLEDGRLAGEGTHAELYLQNSVYRTLFDHYAQRLAAAGIGVVNSNPQGVPSDGTGDHAYGSRLNGCIGRT